MKTRKKALGFARVSQRGGRDDDKLHSPEVQRQQIAALAEREDWELAFLPDEIDVSGNDPLERRPSLSQAVMAVQTDAADVIVGAYSARLFWNSEVRLQVLRLVEAKGGEVWTCDHGRLSNGTATDRFLGGVTTMADAYSREQNAENSRAAVVEAVERGVVPWGSITAGLLRGPDGVCVPDPELAPVVAQAVQMRADRATVDAVRVFLDEHGIERSYNGVLTLLRSPLLVGEIRFGGLVNLHAHEPIVEREVWERAKAVSVPRGRRAKSDRLLARLGVLRCGTCGARMVVGSSNRSAYRVYRCPPNGDCPRRVTIAAELVEGVVVDAVRARLAGIEGNASVEDDAMAAQRDAERAQAAYDFAVQVFTGDEREPAVIEKMAELRQARDDARARAHDLAGASHALSVSVEDWDRLTRDERRELIAATVAAATVAPGRGAGRVAVQLVGE